MGNSFKYNGCIHLEFDAYDAWKDHSGNFEFFFDGDSKLCLCKPDDPEHSCIIIELNVSDKNNAFVQCKKYNSQALPEQRYPNRHQNWNLGTALYACHAFLFQRNDSGSRTFARDLVRYMVDRGPSDEAIRNPINTVKNLMRWSRQLDIIMHVVSRAL